VKRVSKVLAAATIALLSAGAHAEIVKYRFDAKVTSVTEYDPATGIYTDVGSSAFAGADVTIGDTISGLFQYDTSVGPSDYQPTQAPGSLYRSFNSGAADAVSYLDWNTSLAFSSTPELNWLGKTFVQDSAPVPGSSTSDSLLLSRAATDGVFFNGATIWLNDLSGTAFGTADMPATLDLNAFQFASLNAGFLRVSDKAFMGFSAELSSLERADVPEPGSMALFAIAGAGLLRVRRRRG
jgi:hypothetical protein